MQFIRFVNLVGVQSGVNEDYIYFFTRLISLWKVKIHQMKERRKYSSHFHYYQEEIILLTKSTPFTGTQGRSNY